MITKLLYNFTFSWLSGIGFYVLLLVLGAIVFLDYSTSDNKAMYIGEDKLGIHYEFVSKDLDTISYRMETNKLTTTDKELANNVSKLEIGEFYWIVSYDYWFNQYPNIVKLYKTCE